MPSSSHARPATLLAGLLVALSCSACSIFPRARGVNLSSDPPGARVIVDGADSGFVTPCILTLPNKRSQTVRFERPGYRSAERVLLKGTEREIMLWREMTVFYRTWRQPAWLTSADFFQPVKVEQGPFPNRIFVRLQREADR